MHEFINRATGEKLRCEFKIATADTPELLEGLQLCVRDEYGDTYPRSDVYDLPKLADKVRSGQLTVYLAINEDGDPVSSLALSPCGGLWDVPEMTMHVVRRQYRGFGIGTVLTCELLNLPNVKNYSAVATHAVTFHAMAQHQTLNCGFEPCGFLFLVHSNDVLKHTFDVKGCIKQSFAVAVYPESKQTAGELFTPKEHQGFIQKRYDRLGVSYTLSESNAVSDLTVMHTNFDEVHHALTAEIFSGGKDLDAWADAVLNKPHHPHQTINVLVDMNDPGAVYSYETLKRHGFFFTGVHPLCGNGEFLILHNPMNLEVPFEKLCIDEGYKEIFTYIRNYSGGKI